MMMMMKMMMKYWDRFSREVMDVLSLKTFEVRLDGTSLVENGHNYGRSLD